MSISKPSSQSVDDCQSQLLDLFSPLKDLFGRFFHRLFCNLFLFWFFCLDRPSFLYIECDSVLWIFFKCNQWKKPLKFNFFLLPLVTSTILGSFLDSFIHCSQQRCCYVCIIVSCVCVDHHHHRRRPVKNLFNKFTFFIILDQSFQQQQQPHHSFI